DKIKKVLTDIGANKFGAVVSDTVSAMTLAKQYILAKYLAILLIRCIVHHVQLICNDIVYKTLFEKNVLQQYQSFVTFFYTSHRSGAILYNEITCFMINKSGLKKVCIKQILENDNLALISDLRNFIRNQQFWTNAEILAKILLLAKNNIKIVKSKATTMAAIFLFFLQIATAINALEKNSLPEHTKFHKQ
ncbi:10190_t:CDS:2, partial [Cetraspora pellucida]